MEIKVYEIGAETLAGRENSGNIRKYRKPLNVNIGLIIFSVIFIYILICVFLYFTSKHIVGYEVKMGTLSVSNIYKGIALRKEEIVTSEKSGYVNYYAGEGERVGVGNLVYSIDESGKLADVINQESLGENALSDSDLVQLKTEITGFKKNFSRDYFSQVYDFKYNMKGTVLKLANINVLNNIDKISKSGNSELINLCNASKTGIISYNIDGFEEMTPDMISKDTFILENYKKQQLISNELIGSGDPVYKLCSDENWSIVIPIEKERTEELLEKEYIQVLFLKNQNTSWAKVSILQKENDYFAQLDLNNSMITFCSDRFIDIEIITEEEKGLKVPNSSVVEKEFFLVPRDYVIKGGDGSTSGVMKETYTEDGSASTEFIPVSIYNETEDDYYLDDSMLRIGDYIIKPDSTEKYPVSKKGTLIGVYNINKGYADFKQVIILYQNDEYSIVQSNTKYGLSTYDHIVLDAKAVNENEFIYE